jgi:hypothetical protein
VHEIEPLIDLIQRERVSDHGIDLDLPGRDRSQAGKACQTGGANFQGAKLNRAMHSSRHPISRRAVCAWQPIVKQFG